jgi:hypothetical protein
MLLQEFLNVLISGAKVFGEGTLSSKTNVLSMSR